MNSREHFWPAISGRDHTFFLTGSLRLTEVSKAVLHKHRQMVSRLGYFKNKITHFFKKLKIEYDAAMPLLSIYPKERKAGYQTNMCTPTFIAAYSQ